MNLDACKQKIDQYLIRKEGLPLIVDVQNQEDLSALIQQYCTGARQHIRASASCKRDETLQLDSLFEALEQITGTVFVTGVSSFLRLSGIHILCHTLRQLLDMPIAGHAVLLTFQCAPYLSFQDRRLLQRVVILDGEAQSIPQIVFTESSALLSADVTPVIGLDQLAGAVETARTDPLYVITNKRRAQFPDAVYPLRELRCAYDVLTLRDTMTMQLNQTIGTEEQWSFVLDQFPPGRSWAEILDAAFGNHQRLEQALPSFHTWKTNRQWLYGIGLKLYGARGNPCLDTAVSEAAAVDDLTTQVYRWLLPKSHRDPGFWTAYELWKSTLRQLGNLDQEAGTYCKLTVSKGRDALYYLTNLTQPERETIFKVLDQHGLEYDRNRLIQVLEHIYPDLYAYLQPYSFQNQLLNQYFQDYKYQKVINHILPEFEKQVEEQSQRRDYNRLLPPRSSVIEALDREQAQLYFVDAMGVEYLGYIQSLCRELHLTAKITICRCELPSITSRNKEFLTLFDQAHTISIKELDDIKHHGKEDFDYYKGSKLPIHLIRELEILRELLSRIQAKLNKGDFLWAHLVADHGASRLAVLHDTENIWEMSEKGEHAGRCCLKSDVDTQPDFAADAGDFWALANYDRFRGGRKANVEAHGGAALEEVCVPVITLSLQQGKTVEVCLMAPDAVSALFGVPPEIRIGYRKEAALKLFLTEPLEQVWIEVNGKSYPAEPLSDGYYQVDMPDLRRAGTFHADVYSGDTCIAERLPFVTKKAGMQERDVL